MPLTACVNMSTRVYGFYGRDHLVEPRPEIIRRAFGELGDFLISTTPVGIYSDKQAIIRILRSIYEFAERRLSRLFRRIASHETMEFFLYQYDVAAELWHSTDDDSERENHFASRRRGLKHLAEQLAMRSPPEMAPIQPHNLFVEIEEALFYAEFLVMLASMSDQTYFLFPDHTKLTVRSGYAVPFQLELFPPYDTLKKTFGRRLIVDRQYRPKCLPNPTADRDTKFQQAILDRYFISEFGVGYGDFLDALVRIMTDVAPAPGSYPIVFYHRDRLAKQLATAAGMPMATSLRIINGFTLRSADMKREGRQLWNTKQTFRAYRRGFFELPHLTGQHLIWSNKMADESRNWLIEGFAFRKAPAEWDAPAIRDGIDELSREQGNWFETQAARCLNELGVVGCRRKSKIQGHGCAIEVPASVGEIDFLGSVLKDGSLVIVECKMVESRTEARFWKEDMAEFVDCKGSYTKKFNTKINWVLENRRPISRALTGVGPCTQNFGR